MTKRFFEVDLSGTFRVEIDDEALSEPDEDQKRWKVLEAHLDRRRFTERATFKDVLQSLAIYLGVDNRSMSRCDGWADFADEAASARQDGYWEVEGYVEVDEQGRRLPKES